MKKLLISLSTAPGLIGTPAFAADMAVKAAPPAPPPVPTWTGFYAGIQFGGGWSDESVNLSPNGPAAAVVFNGVGGVQGLVTNYRVSQSGMVGGVEAGYNWQWSNWLIGVETDFSGSGMSGTGTATSVIIPGFLQGTTAHAETDWQGTVRGRLGWLATPNLLLFGTGGFAYGRVADSASYSTGFPFGLIAFPFVANCGAAVVTQVTCFTGSSSAIRTGWTAGGGAEYLLDQHWSAKIEYQFVDLGTETVRIVSIPTAGVIPASFNAAFRDRFNVVRLGLNYRF